MNEKEKTATNNQWISIPVETEGAKTSSKEKTAGNNQWTSTNKNTMNNNK